MKASKRICCPVSKRFFILFYFFVEIRFKNILFYSKRYVEPYHGVFDAIRKCTNSSGREYTNNLIQFIFGASVMEWVRREFISLLGILPFYILVWRMVERRCTRCSPWRVPKFWCTQLYLWFILNLNLQVTEQSFCGNRIGNTTFLYEEWLGVSACILEI